jgi:hypothetical protein
MRILVTVAQESPELQDITLYCQQHRLDLRRECWQFQSQEYEFHIVYIEESNRRYLNWMYLQWPGKFFEF